MRRRLTELVVLLIVGALLVKWAVEAIRPLVPYMLILVAIIGVIAVIKWWFDRRQTW